ncbi:MAG: ABC transporter ATP-binding protein [Chloroflexi bacterium]|nr:ABC transporter ATP-binding protein [Chloroflexota bacterium]
MFSLKRNRSDTKPKSNNPLSDFPSKSLSFKPLRLVLSYARHYTLILSITALCMILLVGVQLLIPWIIKILISSVTELTDFPQTMGLITRLSLLVLLIFIVRAILQFFRSYLAHIAGWGVVADVRKYIYEHMQRLSLQFYEDKQTGQLMSRVVNDTDLFEQLIAHAIPEVFVNGITFIGVSIVLFTLNWELTLLSMIPIPFIVISMQIYARYVRPAFRQRQKELGDLNAMLNDNLSGIREIKAFTREAEEMKRVSLGIDRYRQSLLRALRLMATFQPFVEFTSSLGLLIVIYFGGKLALQKTLPIADLVAFFLYLDLFYQPVRNLSNAWEQVQGSLAGADRVADLIKEEPELTHFPQQYELVNRAAGAISYQNVSFGYTPENPILEQINLEIPAHQVVALVGPTGVGKSTLVSLLPRFYDVTAGCITLDGQDIRAIKLDSLRQQISIVLQDVFLFHGTVRENILFGKPDASEDEMLSAAKVANAHSFITELSDGYDTLIGERGIKLSGGQKQRISIARAVLKNAPILILDEATSSVDTETEVLIQQALERLIVGRTTIIIAHRLSTIRNADKIVVLDGKHIVEMGTHQQLISRDGLYRRLYTVQTHINAIQRHETDI